MPNKTKLILLSIALAMSSTAMAKIYKWTDASGNTHYTATPPPAKSKAKAKEFKVKKKPASSLTYYAPTHAPSMDASSSERKNKRIKRGKTNQPVNMSGSAADACRGAISKLGVNDSDSLSDCIRDYNSDPQARSKISSMNSSTYDATKDKAAMKQIQALKNAFEQSENKLRREHKDYDKVMNKMMSDFDRDMKRRKRN